VNLSSSPFEGLNFFYMGLTKRWGTEERMIIKDCKLALKGGAKVYLYTYKKTRLRVKAEALGVECIYHKGKFASKIYEWHKLRKLSRLIDELKINVVHCYDIKVLWPLCFYLRQKKLIPLVYTMSTELSRSYKDFWYRPLSSRIDQVILPMPEMAENVWARLGLPPRKINFVGVGIKTRIGESERPPFRFTEDRWYIGTNLNGIETNTQFLDTLFHSFRVMIERKLEGKNYTFALCNERSWADTKLTDELRRQVKDWGLEEHVAFVGPCDIAEQQKWVDLWLGLRRREDLEDYAIQSITSGTPILVPRTSSSMELLRIHGQVGETFKIGDSREIREKCETVLRNLSTYKSNLHKAHQALAESFGHDRYDDLMTKAYQKLLGRRRRLQRIRRQKRKILSLRKKP
jgi:glycosyltransferase involved in cell wall biosynthesis